MWAAATPGPHRMGRADTARTLPDMCSLPLSGDVTQAFNPFQWWGQQAGFININNTRTDDPAMERRIVEQVASYGRQLGRIVDALDVLVARQPDTDLSAAERDALRAFTKMAREIDAAKGGPQPVTLARVDALIDGVRDLARTDPELHREVVDRITAALPATAAGHTTSAPADEPATA
jgi:hypothetical protein